MNNEIKQSKRVGVIACSGGSTLIESRAAMLEHATNVPDFFVITDRACSLEAKCKAAGLTHMRIEDDDNDRFSRRAGRVLVDEWRVDVVVLFFRRIVGPGVCDRVATLNIHPSLLPAYRGFSPLRRAWEDGVHTFGATLHVATTDIDAGPILAQVRQPMPKNTTLEKLERLSFLHKSCLLMLLCEAVSRDVLRGDRSTNTLELGGVPHEPSLSNGFVSHDYRNAFIAMQDRFGLEEGAIQV
jgi:phosphoribosylglycinamide formyltransferase-1